MKLLKGIKIIYTIFLIIGILVLPKIIPWYSTILCILIGCLGYIPIEIFRRRDRWYRKVAIMWKAEETVSFVAETLLMVAFCVIDIVTRLPSITAIFQALIFGSAFAVILISLIVFGVAFKFLITDYVKYRHWV